MKGIPTGWLARLSGFVALFALVSISVLGQSQCLIEVIGRVVSFDQAFGSVSTDITAQALQEAGISVGDLVELRMSGHVVEIPVISELFPQLPQSLPGVILWGNAYIGGWYRNIAAEYDVTLGDEIVICLVREQGYLDEIAAREVDNVESRDECTSDEEYANFREVSCGDIAAGVLFRSSHPADGSVKSGYAHALMVQAGVQTIINVGASWNDPQMAFDNSEYYRARGDEGAVLATNIGLAVTWPHFKTELARVLRFMIDHSPPYLIHCSLGQDRAGITSAVLEALAGTDLQDVIDNYALTFANYYQITPGHILYPEIVEQLLSKFWEMSNGAEVSSGNLQGIVEAYLRSEVGLSESEIRFLQEKLSGSPHEHAPGEPAASDDSPDVTEAANAVPQGRGLEEDLAVTRIFYNGIVVPMTQEGEAHEAIAVSGARVLALGSSEEMLALSTPSTELLDLRGAAVFPGFIDPHAHVFQTAVNRQQENPLESGQQDALRSGITLLVEMGTKPWLAADLEEFAKADDLKVRVRMNLNHITGCGDILGEWYVAYEPGSEIAPNLTVGGVKLFSERSWCGSDLLPVFSSELKANFPDAGERWLSNELVVQVDELTSIIARAQATGRQVFIHAIGDLGIETSLDAIEAALDGEPNTLRHAILHNHYIREDLLPRYEELGIVALVEPTSPCYSQVYAQTVGEGNRCYFKPWLDLVESGVHVALNSDLPAFPLDPMMKLQSVVSYEEVLPQLLQYAPCEPHPCDQLVSVWQGLRMLTSEAAYAIHMEDELGTLEPGKLADLVVLTRNPLEVRPNEIGDIDVMMTIIGGSAEYLHPSFNAVKPDELAPSEMQETVSNLVIDNFDDGDMQSMIGSSWVLGTWNGGSLLSPMRVARDQVGAYLLLATSSHGGVSAHTPFGEMDLSEYTGVYVTLSADTGMNIGLALESRDAEWPKGSRETLLHRSIAASDTPTTITIPFKDFLVEEWKWASCPQCATELDPSRITLIGIETSEGGGELRIYEVGLFSAPTD